jgi:Mg-chelatase subunit ChlD
MSKLPTGKDSARLAWLKKFEEASGKSLDDRHGRLGALTAAAVILVIDCSGSMDGDKIRQARDGALGFGRDAMKRGYSVGVVQFGSEAETLVAPSRSDDSVSNALGRLRITGSTNMAAGIDVAVAMLGGGGNHVICIVTDGVPDSAVQTIASAKQARTQGIEIMAVGTDDADWAFLSQIVSRKELATKIDRQALGRQIASMARMLPQLTQRKT